MPIPRDAEITVVGGGAIGAAVAYFLARDGRRDIQLLERRGLCEATSSQAAGLVGQARPTAERARLTMAAADTYRTFERDTGYTMDYKECGAVRLALSETSVRELQQIADTAAVTGLPVEFLSPARLREVYPVLECTDSVKAALWSPTDGYLQPNSLVSAYVQAARDLGVTVATQTAVTGIEVADGAVRSVATEGGSYRTEQVIIAAGPWSSALSRSSRCCTSTSSPSRCPAGTVTCPACASLRCRSTRAAKAAACCAAALRATAPASTPARSASAHGSRPGRTGTCSAGSPAV
jgi:glycine/D-amino acid oxidase-like deaminating enzyme